jgi:hypothetical protein
MRSVQIEVSVSDVCSGMATCSIVGVRSNGRFDDKGRKQHDRDEDWQITGPLTLRLRAERAGHDDKRVYTITVWCADAAVTFRKKGPGSFRRNGASFGSENGGID